LAEEAVEVRPARDEGEVEAAKELRLRVFSGEQGVPRDHEIDGLDPESVHLIALRGGSVVATCRLRFLRGRCKLERMAVDPGLRRTGIGRLLVAGAEHEASRRGAAEIVLHSQRRAEDFYAGCGYAAEGETFLAERIAHVLMRKPLDGTGPEAT
jgi:predicted GNAT family N-acyltransferase